MKLAHFAFIFWGMVAGSMSRAHDPGLSTAQGELRADAFVLTTGFAPADAQHFLPASVRTDEKWTELEFETVRDQLMTFAPQLWDVRVGEVALAPRGFRVELLPGDNVSFQVEYPPLRDAGRVTLRALKLGELPPSHRQFVMVSDEQGSVIAKKLLSARDMTLEVKLPGISSTDQSPGALTAGSDAPTFWGFLKLGVEHIWTGYDHLLFLFGLLVVCRSFRSMVGIVSCFTLAHSLMLALATLELVTLPSRLVEAAIAASIVFVGLENLVRRGEEPRGRWALTFAFGLVHGFGFASVLRDLGVGRGGDGIAMPLFTFNLGVEIGQIAVASVVLPVVWQLRKRPAFLNRAVPMLSALVATAGLYWLVERTAFA